MRRFLSGLAVWLVSATLASAQMMGISGGPFTVSSYSGPGDIVSGASFWYGLRGYNAAHANNSTKAINVRCGSGANVGATFDVTIISGQLDNATAFNTCANDGTFTATIATTVLSVTALGSGQITSGDQISGVGVLNPTYVVSPGTCVSGAVVPPCTFNISQSQTVSVGVSMTAAGNLHVSKWYDQVAGNNCGAASCDAVQATAALQPLLLANCFNALPCVAYNNALSLVLTSANNFTPATGTASLSAVYERTGAVTGGGTTVGMASPLDRMTYGLSANQARVGAGTLLGATANDNTAHAVNAGINGASSFVNVDGTATSGTTTSSTTAGAPQIGSNATMGYVTEGGFWDNVVFTSPQQASMHTNQSAYWGTP